MSMNEAIRGIMIPFIGTSLGAALVFFMKREIHPQLQRALTGFAAGVMAAASVWSLLLPAIDQSGALGKGAFLPAAGGFWLGVLFLLFLDRTVPHLHMNSDQAEGAKASLPRNTMMLLAVTIHNIPEGMSRTRAFLGGVLTGAVEPLGAALMIALAGLLAPAMPWFLSFAAGAMLYVVVEELIPEMSQEPHSNIGTVLFSAGFTVMMALDVALG